MTIRVLELFSGMGGTHAALKASGVDLSVVCAADINTVANAVYAHSFPETPCISKNIECFPADKPLCDFDLLTMSPPCQPFTRNGTRLDLGDARTKPFVSVVNALGSSSVPVEFVFVENVKGFEVSGARKMLLEVLQKRDYHVAEFLLCPTQFGIPNSRLRYYMLARRRPFPFATSGQLLTAMPAGFGPEENPEYYRPIVQVLSPPRSVRDVLTAEVHHAQRFLSKPVLLKYANLLDVATPASRRTCCFTKAYGHYLEGSGSVFAENPEAIETVFSSITESSTEEAKYEALASLRLRFFSPREVSRLMCFPEYHSFPDDVTEKQRYRLLGNSVNVFVVATLMKLLIQS